MTDLMTTLQVNRDRARQHRRKAADALQEQADSFERCDTDGFLSQWASGKTAELETAKAEIAEAGGTATFTGLYDGDRRVKAKLTRYMCKFTFSYKRQWVLHDDEIKKYGRKWIPTGKRSRIQKELGLSERLERAPAYAFMNGEGTGLSGSAWAETARVNHEEWGTDSTIEPEESNDGE